MPTQYKKNFIILHHTLTDRDTTTFNAVNNYHKDLWNFESSLGYFIGYHYFITADGKVTQGRADWEAGAHCYQENKNYVLPYDFLRFTLDEWLDYSGAEYIEGDINWDW